MTTTYYYHPVSETGHKRKCPLTGREFNHCWTNHELPGSFNQCDECGTVANQLPPDKWTVEIDGKFVKITCVICGESWTHENTTLSVGEVLTFLNHQRGHG